MITYEKLQNKPKQFQAFTGINITQFRELIQAIKPVYAQNEQERLRRAKRKRKNWRWQELQLESGRLFVGDIGVFSGLATIGCGCIQNLVKAKERIIKFAFLYRTFSFSRSKK